MAFPSPATTDLVVKHDLKGKTRVFFKGVALPGVIRVDLSGRNGERSELTITLTGAAVRLETEDEAID